MVWNLKIEFPFGMAYFPKGYVSLQEVWRVIFFGWARMITGMKDSSVASEAKRASY